LLIKVAAGEWNEELALESFDEGSTILVCNISQSELTRPALCLSFAV